MMNMKTVLVVDDSSTIRAIIADELDSAGYKVYTAEDGAQAIDLLMALEPSPDLLTLDIDMPGMDGFELCRRIRTGQIKGGKSRIDIEDIPIIFISDFDTLENREHGYQLGVIDFISKPFAKGKLRDMVNMVLHPEERFDGMCALIAEDSPDVRRLASRSLERAGVKIIEAGDGEEALRLLEDNSESFDIIITDYQMPGMKGDELCGKIQSMEKMAQVPVFVISAYDDKEKVIGFFKVGASDYLRKPFIVEEFHARVVTHLRVRKYVNEMRELNRKLKIQATRDELTGLYNRRYFKDMLQRHFAQAHRYTQDLCCLLLDLDYFKRVNDTHGHAFGDLVLSEFAELISTRIRESDIAGRYGGEEFIVILPSTGLEGAMQLAEQIRTISANHLYQGAKAEMYVTCSIGVASLQHHNPETAERLIYMADKGLYSAKAHGRNQVKEYRSEEIIRYGKLGKNLCEED
jgi:two-component system cell cycle response regulator